MPAELAESSSSQGSRTNPRLRNTQRVRAVPYECCGGFYNFFSTGCFAMCCAGPKSRRNSTFGRRNSKRKQKISEPPKRLIKPNAGDGLTAAEKDEFKTSDPILFYPNDDDPSEGLYVSKFDIELDEDVVSTKQLDQENDSIFTLNDDNISHLTTDISVAGSETSGKPKKSKKKLTNILRFRKKKKGMDDLSTTSSNVSEAVDTQSFDTNDADPDTLTKIQENETVDSIPVEEIQETDDFKGKVDELQSEPKQVLVDESDFIKIAKILPLGASAAKQESNVAPSDEIASETKQEINVAPPDEIASETPEPSRKKKSFWRSSSRKSSSEGSKSDSEKASKKSKSFLGKWGSLKRTQNAPTESGSEETDEVNVTESENEAPKSGAKKKTLFGTLRSKKSKAKGQKTAVENAASSDSIEVRTVESCEGVLEDDSCPIKIIRNQFFLDEINSDASNRIYRNEYDVVVTGSNGGDEVECLGTGRGNVEDKNDSGNASRSSAEIKEGNLRDAATGLEGGEVEGDKLSDPTEREVKSGDAANVEDNLRETVGGNVEDAKENLGISDNDKNASLVTPNEKQYGIIDKEDFSDSLHTLVDNDPDYIILATTDVISDTNSTLKSATYLPDDMFRSSYATSIDGSSEQDTQSRQCDGNFEIFAMSTDNLVQVNDVKRSTDTLTDTKEEGSTVEWVEIANVDQLNDSQFGYIYKTTMKKLNGDVKTEEVSDELEGLQGESNEVQVQGYNHAGHPIPASASPLGDAEETKDDVVISEAHSSPTLGSKTGSKSATPSPIATKSRSGTLSSTNSEWQHAEEDIDRLMVMQGRSSLSSLGLRSDSMASVYSGAGEGRYGTVTVKGHVEFGLQYNYKAGALEIHVKQCKDLASVDTKRNRSDPYVKVYLLPDKSKGGKRKTKVKKHTLNPVFDETLKFHISLNGLETRTLWLTVWHSDMFGRNDFLGEVMMTLENKVFDDPTPKLYNLQERTEPFDDTISFKGDIIVCLKFVPPDMTVQKKGKRSRGTLHVLVKEAKYLTAYKANGTSDPFCKSYLLPDKGRNSKQKTAVVKKTVNPVWNHTFIYDDVTLQELAERCLELTVWDHDRLASNEFLGGVRFSLGTGKHYGKAVEWMDSSGKEVSLWKNMLERPNFWVEGSLSLRPTLDARTS